MYKRLIYGIMSVLFALPFSSQAQTNCMMGGKNDAMLCEVSFTQIPTFTPTMSSFTGQIGVYTIRNNTRAPIGLTGISLVSNPGDTLPASAAFIDPTFPNSCGTSLAPFASCNIRVALFPLTTGVFNRTLHIGLNSRQCGLNSPVIGVAVTAILEPVIPGLVSPFFGCLLTSTASLSNASPASIVLGGVCSGSSIGGFPPGFALALHENDVVANADIENLAVINAFLDTLCPGGIPLPSGTLTNATLPAGNYCLTGDTEFAGTLILQGPGTFRIISPAASSDTLSFAPGTQVVLVGGTVPSQVIFRSGGETPSIGSGTLLQGIYLSTQSSLTIGTGVTVIGAVKSSGASFSIEGPVMAIAP